MAQENKKTTLGQRRVRVEFNPSKQDYVQDLKMAGANFIDLIDGAANNPNFSQEQLDDFRRLKSLAITHIEDATMWAVKAATV